MGLTSPAAATTPPPATGRPLGEALNPDGTLRPGLNGSFDARQFRMGTAPDGRPVFRPTGTKGAGDERWQDGFGLANGTDGLVKAVLRVGNDIYVGGSFTAVGNVPASGLAKWNGTAWSIFGVGFISGVVGASINALAVAGNGDLYVGGAFTQAGGAIVHDVAKWNGTVWSRLGMGATSGTAVTSINALAVVGNGGLYVGGTFTQAGGIGANNVARWNGTTWSSLGASTANGVNGPVNALVVATNGNLYAGGAFTQAGGAAQAGGVTANAVARWNGAFWSSLDPGTGSGVSSTVYSMAVASNGDLYVGGQFVQAGAVSAYRIAKWNGTAWSSLGGGTGPTTGLNGLVYALAVAANGDVYAGGTFTLAGGATAKNVAKWDGTAWSSLGTGAANGVFTTTINALTVVGNGDLYMGGDFMQADGAMANRVAKWNGTAWSSLDMGPGNGVNGPLNALAVARNGDLYVGGIFTQAGGVAANNVAKWNGTAWSSLGTSPANGVDGIVFALAVAANGDVYAGGTFGWAGGASANNVAKWNGTAWNSLGTGPSNGVDGIVYALAVAGNGDVYAGGGFGQAGGASALRVARWNGTAWSSLSTGTFGASGFVYALAVAANGDVYVGGKFTQAGGVLANRVAKWDGTAWSSLGTGTSNGVGGFVYALAVASNGDVYVGGEIGQAGGATAIRVARWNGTAWSALGAGVGTSYPQAVYAVALAANGDVYVGGNFTQASGVVTNYVTRWNGSTWSSLGTGTNAVVNTLATGPTGKLYAGGYFTTTGDGGKAMSRFGIYDPSAPLAAAAKAAPAGQLFPNPAHGTATLRLPAGAPRLALTLTDALGRTVRRYPAPATAETELDLHGLPAGSYVVHCGAVGQRLVVE